MSRHADFLVRGEPETTRSIGDQVLRDVGFTTVWKDRATCQAKRGSLLRTMLLGTFAGKQQVMKVGLTIFAGPQPGTTMVRLSRDSSGFAAGFIGISRNRKMFVELIQELATPFRQTGTLLGVTQS